MLYDPAVNPIIYIVAVPKLNTIVLYLVTDRQT